MSGNGPAARLSSWLDLGRGFLSPLKYIEFDKHKCNQPQECIPEINEIALKAPVDGRQKQYRIEHVFAEVTKFQHRAGQAAEGFAS